MTGYGSYGLDSMYSSYSGPDSTWLTISLVLAIVGGIVAYFLFVCKKNNSKSPFLKWLHSFLNFRKFIISAILKIMYICTAIFITLGSFAFIRVGVAQFFLILLVGNLVARITYEATLMFITLVNNSSEIRKAVADKEEKKK